MSFPIRNKPCGRVRTSCLGLSFPQTGMGEKNSPQPRVVSCLQGNWAEACLVGFKVYMGLYIHIYIYIYIYRLQGSKGGLWASPATSPGLNPDRSGKRPLCPRFAFVPRALEGSESSAFLFLFSSFSSNHFARSLRSSVGESAAGSAVLCQVTCRSFGGCRGGTGNSIIGCMGLRKSSAPLFHCGTVHVLPP